MKANEAAGECLSDACPRCDIIGKSKFFLLALKLAEKADEFIFEEYLVTRIYQVILAF